MGIKKWTIKCNHSSFIKNDSFCMIQYIYLIIYSLEIENKPLVKVSETKTTLG